MKKTMEKFPNGRDDLPSQLCGPPGATPVSKCPPQSFLYSCGVQCLLQFDELPPLNFSRFVPRQRWKYLRISESDRVNQAFPDIK